MENAELILGCMGIVLSFLSSILAMTYRPSYGKYFTKQEYEMLKVPEDSKLRKLLPFFKDPKNGNPKFLYINVIPLIISFFILVIMGIIFLIDMTVVDFVSDTFYFVVGVTLIILECIYDLIIGYLPGKL